jgi:hypothetical protein
MADDGLERTAHSQGLLLDAAKFNLVLVKPVTKPGDRLSAVGLAEACIEHRAGLIELGSC